ncbi:MAG: rhamnulokinase [Cetobacterium sp.]
MRTIEYFLAIDIGASSGRHLLGYLENNILKIEEIHRFKNGLLKVNENICWDLDYLFEEILKGMKKCSEMNKVPKSMGIDTWGVDFVLLDKNEKPIGNYVSYRDNRTRGQMKKVLENISKREIYQKTGIQFQDFNTLYQLKSLPKSLINNAVDFLMIPDYFNFLLTGKKTNEYTNITTTQLLNLKTNTIDNDLLNCLEMKKEIFQKISFPKEKLGKIKKELEKRVGYNCDVILTPTHDTASAFMSNIIPDKKNGVIISSGTWSLLGMEIDDPINNELALGYNFTNEGGVDKKYRFLKNIMGMWIIQEVVRNLNFSYSYEQLVELAKENLEFNSLIDVNDDRFFSCENMIEEISKYCLETNQRPPQNVGELSICIYKSLVRLYKNSILELEKVTGKKIDTINIIGGGCQNRLLNELLKKELDIDLYIGPIEATGIGNILTQMLAFNVIANREEGKNILKNTIQSGVRI